MKKTLLSLLLAFVTVLMSSAAQTTFSITNADSQTKDGVTVSFAKGDGSNAPASQTTFLRLYAKNTITITSTGDPITAVSIAWTKNSKKDFATVTASPGTYTHPTAAGTGIWSGSAKSITFTVGDSGQIQTAEITVTTGTGTGETGETGVTTYTLVTDAANLKAGDKVILAVANDTAWEVLQVTSTNNNSATVITEVTSTGNTITYADGMTVFDVENSNVSGYPFALKWEKGYIGNNNSNGTFKTNSTIAAGYAIKYTPDGSNNNIIECNNSNSQKYLSKNAGTTTYYRFYANNSGYPPFKIFKRDGATEPGTDPDPEPDPKTATTITFAEPGLSLNIGEKGTNAATVKAGDTPLGTATVTWSVTEGAAYASVDADGVVSGLAVGTATITATYAGDDTYEGSTESYMVTVTPAAERPDITAGTYTLPATGVGMNVFFGHSEREGDQTIAKNSIEWTGEQEGITITVTNGESTNSYLNATEIRGYTGYTFTFAAPTGFKISKIETTTTSKKKFTENTISATPGTLTVGEGTQAGNLTWEGTPAKTVVFNVGGTGAMSVFKITLVEDVPVLALGDWTYSHANESEIEKGTNVTISCENAAKYDYTVTYYSDYYTDIDLTDQTAVSFDIAGDCEVLVKAYNADGSSTKQTTVEYTTPHATLGNWTITPEADSEGIAVGTTATASCEGAVKYVYSVTYEGAKADQSIVNATTTEPVSFEVKGDCTVNITAYNADGDSKAVDEYVYFVAKAPALGNWTWNVDIDEYIERGTNVTVSCENATKYSYTVDFEFDGYKDITVNDAEEVAFELKGNCTVDIIAENADGTSVKLLEDQILMVDEAPLLGEIVASLAEGRVDKGSHVTVTCEGAAFYSYVVVDSESNETLADVEYATSVDYEITTTCDVTIIAYNADGESKYAESDEPMAIAQMRSKAQNSVSKVAGAALARVTIHYEVRKTVDYWDLVTDASTLRDGDKVVIASLGSNTNTNKVLSTNQKNNNRGSVGVTFNSDYSRIESFSVVTEGTKTYEKQVLTLKDADTEGQWRFYTGAGYLSMFSGTSTYDTKNLLTKTDPSAATDAVISITNNPDDTSEVAKNIATITFQGTNAANQLQYNSTANTGDLFSCYKSGQQPVRLYRETEYSVYLINLVADGNGSVEMKNVVGTENIECNGGNAREITATPAAGYVFAGWYVGDTKVSDDATYTFTPNDDVTFTAKFEELKYNVHAQLISGVDLGNKVVSIHICTDQIAEDGTLQSEIGSMYSSDNHPLDISVYPNTHLYVYMKSTVDGNDQFYGLDEMKINGEDQNEYAAYKNNPLDGVYFFDFPAVNEDINLWAHVNTLLQIRDIKVKVAEGQELWGTVGIIVDGNTEEPLPTHYRGLSDDIAILATPAMEGDEYVFAFEKWTNGTEEYTTASVAIDAISGEYTASFVPLLKLSCNVKDDLGGYIAVYDQPMEVYPISVVRNHAGDPTIILAGRAPEDATCYGMAGVNPNDGTLSMSYTGPVPAGTQLYVYAFSNFENPARPYAQSNSWPELNRLNINDVEIPDLGASFKGLGMETAGATDADYIYSTDYYTLKAQLVAEQAEKGRTFNPAEYQYPYLAADGHYCYKLKTPVSGPVSIVAEFQLGELSGIDNIESAEADGNVEVYTLQGVRVNADNLTPGFYIMRQGSKATKILVK